MEAKERIIVALDVSRLDDVTGLAKQLGPHVGCFKIGLELLSSEGGPRAVSAIKTWYGDVFYDSKFMDIPNTVAGASRAVTRLGVKMFNVHCLGGFDMKIIPSAHKEIMEQARREDVQNKVFTLANIANNAGLDGVIASPQEIKRIRRVYESDFLIVTPGIRASDAPPDDQKRTATAAEAIKAGANYIVVGRPITKALDPVAAAQKIAEEIEQAHKEKEIS